MTLTLDRPETDSLAASFLAAPQEEQLISDVSAQIEQACKRIAPLWPLKNFVAVNPFVGLSDRHFVEAGSLVQRVTHGDMMMPLPYYRQQWEAGRISSADLQNALDHARQTLPATQAHELDTHSVETLQAALSDSNNSINAAIFTVIDLLDARRGTQWNSFVVDEISKWCSAFYDEGQASWRMPWRGESLFAAWREAALCDANPEMMGLSGFRNFLRAQPDDATAAIEYALQTLQVPAASTVDFLHRALMSISGWSGYVQYQVREKSMYGNYDDSLQHLLAIRLAYDVALYQRDTKFQEMWAQHVASWPVADAASPQLLANYLWQLASELAYQRALIGDIGAAAATQRAVGRRAVQAVFCIDVRSEVFRRSLEAQSPDIETVGFAGFFGFPIEYIPFGQRHGQTQCPVLLTPAFRIRETLPDATHQQTEAALGKQRFSRRLGRSWNSFKTSAVSCFAFVETGGLLSGVKIVKDSLGLHHEEHAGAGMAPGVHYHPAPDSGHGHNHAHLHESGMTVEQQVAVAAGALKNMGLTQNLARLVMICGHGSSTTNNPYGSGLDCGACGGHSGEANARVAATVLNHPPVRAGLKAQGISIPDDSHFLAALHNTTTDDVTLFDESSVPESHAAELGALKQHLEAASRQTRIERAPSLGLTNAAASEIDALVRARSTDWAQTRPEWGLAGNAAFIAAPRERTQQLDLGGRSFLNNYNYSSDEDLSKLELVMTAPMVVASWINLQYFASTVNNRQFGSGNKTIHNVVGALGVWQGNCGDLQVGLPLQSVHDGEKWIHEPLRLSVFIEAPREAIVSIVAKHAGVRELLDNGWLHLIAIEDEGRHFARYKGNLGWESAN
ncbi:MAG TPA: DUF2309 domain-containing protein [Abditibacteriaceae bacterium]|jgi:hypothetical protein